MRMNHSGLGKCSTICSFVKLRDFLAYFVMLNCHYFEQAIVDWDGFPDRKVGREFFEISNPVSQVIVHSSCRRYQDTSDEKAVEQTHCEFVHGSMARRDVSCLPFDSEYLIIYSCREVDLTRLDPSRNHHFCFSFPAFSPLTEKTGKHFFDRFDSIAFASSFSLFVIENEFSTARGPFHGHNSGFDIVPDAQPIFR